MDISSLVERSRACGVRRTLEHRWVAGVCTGLGVRLRIDPVLFRVGFLVLAIAGGVGILAYLVCWLLLPSQEDRVALEGARRGAGRDVTLLVCTVLTAVLVVLPGPDGSASTVLGLVLLGAAVWWLRGRATPPPGTASLGAGPPAPSAF